MPNQLPPQPEIPRTLCDPGAAQRWTHRRLAWRRPDSVFDPAAHAVDVIPDALARRFVVDHHYSASMPASRLNVGLFEGAALVGVAVFSVPMGEAVLKRWTGFGIEGGVELGRLVLLDRVAFNAESWFLARSLRALAAEKPSIRGVVAFSDPLPRRSEDGGQTLRGHVGTIYAASNAIYAGRTRPRRLWLDRDGRVVSERALSKLRAEDRGARYVYDRLRAAGAPARAPGEAAPAYVARALAEGPFRSARHPGNHAFLLPAGKCDRLRGDVRRNWEASHGRPVYPCRHAESRVFEEA